MTLADTPRVGIKQFFPSPTSKRAAFSCEIEPPEARVRTPRAMEAKVEGPFTLTSPSYRRLPLISIFSETPNRRRRARGP
ncbi:hypothetical protein GGF50DRAFT_121862 [Schizophyllum commune]